MVENPLILIVDDDLALRELLQRYLGEQGFETAAVADGQAMKAWLNDHDPDLVVMDLMLPGEDGLSLTRRLRATTDFPVLILSAKGEDIDRIVGLEIGADDYLAKPFNPRELVARIRAVLRRNSSPDRHSSDDSQETNCFRFGHYLLNLNNHSLYKDEQEVPLTSGELALLAVLVQHPNHVLSRDHLIELLKGYDRSPFDRSIDVRVTRLRHKIEADPKQPRYVRTVWGKGYMFTPQGNTH
ncbi:MAG TPA: response regulator [Thiolapillus brandeum]|uniref:Response regulator n=1 Tax=Thiolapillus brandeum TaxID=1076588 RepID=A0A831K5D6_9GAMM|nr:response regulator [Thiolapillus brandeum]